MNHWIFQHVANGLSGKASLIKDAEVVVFQQDVVTDGDEYFVWQLGCSEKSKVHFCDPAT